MKEGDASCRPTPADSSPWIANPVLALCAILAGAVIALALLNAYFGGRKTNFEDAAALGAQTTSWRASVDGHSIHCMDARDAEGCLAGARARKARHSVLWLGNSQVDAINQWQPGETNGVPVLFNALGRRGLDLVTFNQPNANLQEHYVLFEYLRRRLPLRVLILSAVFDDTREEGLRDTVAEFARDEATAAALSLTEIGRRLVPTAPVVPQDGETAGIAGTLQERSERGLTTWLDEHSRLWQMRPEIRGQIFFGLYKLRNAVFGIKATSKRKLILGRYRDNLAAMEAILNAAAQARIKVVLYVAPLRGGVEIPYVAEEYASFKSDMEKLASRSGVTYANLESLVPDDLWGTKEATVLDGGAELDFMHFRAGGHRLLAERLDGLVAEAMAGAEARR